MSVSNRRIDHLVLAVRDLDAAADFYERLGFQVGQRNRHPWGTENRLIQFETSFLELITIGDDSAAIPPHGPEHFSFGAFVRDYLDKREGCAMFVLDSADAKADATSFASKGIGRFDPFFFERRGRRPDGNEMRVAFTLAFAMDPRLPDASFFVCEQHVPENFWNAAFQNHANGAVGIESVTLRTATPPNHTDFLSGFVGVAGKTVNAGGLMFPLQRGGRLLVEPGNAGAGFSGFAIIVSDLRAVERHVRQSGVPFMVTAHGLAIEKADAFGVELLLRAAAD